MANTEINLFADQMTEAARDLGVEMFLVLRKNNSTVLAVHGNPLVLQKDVAFALGHIQDAMEQEALAA